MRPCHTWMLFGLCLAVVLAAMGYVSVLALRLDRAEAQARRQAAVEENVRLALWRMDSALAPLIAQESGRPYFAYSPFYPAERAYTRMFAELEHGEVLVPSALLTYASPHILLHFQFGPDDAPSSPQVPMGNMRDLAEVGYTTHEAVEEAARRLRAFQGLVGREALLAALASAPAELPPPLPLAQVPQQDAPAGPGGGLAQAGPQQEQPQPGPQQDQQARLSQAEGQQGQQTLLQQAAAEQDRRNTLEFQMRNYRQFELQRKGQANPQSAIAAVAEGALAPVWVGEALVLARCVGVGKTTYLQGCWLDWPAIRGWLLGEVADLLPAADLEPARGAPAVEGRALASLPLRLRTGGAPMPRGPVLTPVRVSLLIAWGCVLIGAGAVALLLRGAVVLSERRGAFVSAVTHELRTPLTTFHMYTEMLAEGMVTDVEKRRGYLQTLRREAERLTHLVENVLAYARLERGRADGRLEAVPLGDLLDRLSERLAARAGQAEMTLTVEGPAEARAVTVRTDVAAVGQILFNLVDNACKYAAAAADRRIHLVAGCDGAMAALRVCDHGPGIGAVERRRLFRPFSKSAREAAGSAPGVGLGLALSRRLARRLGGDLRLEDSAHGACFVLTLPLVRI